MACVPEQVTGALARGSPQEEQALGAKAVSESGGEVSKQPRNSGWEMALNCHRWRGQGQVEAVVIPWEDKGRDRAQGRPPSTGLMEKHATGYVPSCGLPDGRLSFSVLSRDRS